MSADATWVARGVLGSVGMGRQYGALKIRVSGEPAMMEVKCAPQLTKAANRLVGHHVRAGGQVTTWAGKGGTSGNTLFCFWVEQDEPWADNKAPVDDGEAEIPGF